MASVCIPASTQVTVLVPLQAFYLIATVVMGNCWNSPLPEEAGGDVASSQVLPHGAYRSRKAVEFGKEEVKLNELLASLRTGLSFAPTTFRVLPGKITTTSKVFLTIGNSELHRRQEEALKEVTFPEDDNKNKVESEEEGKLEPVIEPYKLKMSLEGTGWVKDLVIMLTVQPAVGPFAGRELLFHWKNDNLEISGCEVGELQAHGLPIMFEDEEDFCRNCLSLVFQSSLTKRTAADEEEASDHPHNEVKTLRTSAYKVAISNLDMLPEGENAIPAKLYHIFFGSHKPASLVLTLWPRKHATSDASLKMKVRQGILFAELVYLVKEHFHLQPTCSLKLYNNHRPIHLSEQVSSDYAHLDCFVVSHSDRAVTSCTCLEEEEEVCAMMAENLVVSLVGKQIQDIEVNLDIGMKEFDMLIREKFELSEDTFLVTLAEDDLAPQYTADDNWKCTYPFHVPDSSFTSGLRRSFHKLSSRRGETDVNTFTPHMEEVLELLSSDQRQFPRHRDKRSAEMRELYDCMPLYQMNIEQCGIHPHSIIQVFEVTGPSIPITVRILFDNAVTSNARAGHTRLANILDINPDWSISTFLQYIDAVVSLSSSSWQKRLLLKDKSVDDTNDLSGMKLGALLDAWKPLWWPGKGCKRKKLNTKEIDPSEYLIIEKFGR